MLTVSNVKVYDLKESVIACRNSMRTEQLTEDQYTEEEFKQSLERAIKLADIGSGGHANFRKGIRVSFDIKYPIYWSKEAQRYHFFDIVNSSSTMHRLTSMDIDKSCNKYVTKEVKEALKSYIEEYNSPGGATYENFMKVVSNCPCGLELFMRVSTNYEQLATMYKQRKSHRLKEDWGEFCKFIESLPYAKELIGVQSN